MAFAKFPSHGVAKACQACAHRLNDIGDDKDRLKRVMHLLEISVAASDGYIYLTTDDFHDIASYWGE